MTQKWRVSNGASSLRTELMAIKGALEYIENVMPRNALIATDSKAALQTLKKNKAKHNVHLVTLVHKTAQALQEAGTQLCLIWIPSHIGIHGNDKADTAAKEAATKENINIIATQSLTLIKSNIKKHISINMKQEHATEVTKGSPSALWYAQAIQLKHLSLPPNLPNKTMIHIHRIRMGYPSPGEMIVNEIIPPCNHCNKDTDIPLLHYIF